MGIKFPAEVEMRLTGCVLAVNQHIYRKGVDTGFRVLQGRRVLGPDGCDTGYRIERIKIPVIGCVVGLRWLMSMIMIPAIVSVGVLSMIQMDMIPVSISAVA
jgi:hypothetical protein